MNEELISHLALLDLLPTDCLDCREKPQDGPCLPEHCSKILCSDCKTSHLKKFSVELVAELQTMKKQVSEQQAMCNDDSELTKMVDQSKAAIAEVTRVFDAEKEKLIDAIKKKQEISSSNYFQWKENFNHCLAQGHSFMDKALSDILHQEDETQSGEFLSDVKKQITQEREAISGVEEMKKQLPVFDVGEVLEVFDRMRSALYESIMPRIPDYTAARWSQSYGKDGSGAGEFNYPWGVACSPVTGNLAISDQNNHRIHILTADLTPVRVLGTGGSEQDQLRYPRGVCFSSSGALFIVDVGNHRIQQVNEEGEHIRTLGCEGSGVGEFSSPCGICLEGGLLYICDYGNYRLQIMTESGVNVRTIGSKGSAPGLFSSPPWYIDVSSQHDRLVVSDTAGNLHFFSIDGEHRKTIQAGQRPYNVQAGSVMIDERGQTPFNVNAGSVMIDERGQTPFNVNAGSVMIDEVGQLIVSDKEEGCLVVLGEDKVVATIRLPAGERMGHPLGVTRTSDGSIILCDWYKHQIHKITVPQIQ